MASVETYLWNVVGAYEPSALQKEAASGSQRNLRDLLNTGQIGDRITGSFLSGSYSRDTAIRPIDDVDIIFTIDIRKWPTPVGTSAAFPEQVLDTFANAIRYRYPVSSVFGQRRSVRLQLYHLNIDVVPAVPHERASFLWIPDKNENKWLLSAPAIHAQLATQVNQRSGGKFKPLVKLLKAWNANLAPPTQMRSFAIETMCVRLFSTIPLETLQSGMLVFFDFVTALGGTSTSHFRWNDSLGMTLNWSQAVIPDAAGTGTNVAERIEQSRITSFINECIRRRDLLLRIEQVTSQTTASLWARELVK